jgi:hypothetical protein
MTNLLSTVFSTFLESLEFLSKKVGTLVGSPKASGFNAIGLESPWTVAPNALDSAELDLTHRYDESQYLR